MWLFLRRRLEHYTNGIGCVLLPWETRRSAPGVPDELTRLKPAIGLMAYGATKFCHHLARSHFDSGCIHGLISG